MLILNAHLKLLLFHSPGYKLCIAYLGICLHFWKQAVNVLCINNFRRNGYEKDSVHTYGMITGMINSGLALGSMIGPILGGAITQVTDFPNTLTVMAFLNFAMVRFTLLNQNF